MKTMTSLAVLFCLSFVACSSDPSKTVAQNDPYIWLEDSKNPKVMDWVKEHNAKSGHALLDDPRAAAVQKEIGDILMAPDRIAYPRFANGKVRNFWQDEKNPRGVWRETTIAEYQKADPKWNVILDIDAMNKAENKSWVFHGANCLPPQDDLCLLSLSDGGRDEVVVREFQVSKKSFVKSGFVVPAAKTDVAWYDQNTLIIGTNFGPESLTTSGYPRQVRLWKRKTPMFEARLIFEGHKEDVSIGGGVSFRPEGKEVLIVESITTYEAKVFRYNKRHLKQLPFPQSASVDGIFKGFYIAHLREDWKVGDQTYIAGTVLSLPIANIAKADALKTLQVVYRPDEHSAFKWLEFTRDFAEITVLHDVVSEIDQYQRKNGEWVSTKLPLPSDGRLDVMDTSAFDEQNRIFVQYQSFAKPNALYLGSPTMPFKIVKQLPARFDATDVTSEQYEATSKDGTKIPYFIVHRGPLKHDGAQPVLMYGYGGFEISMLPSYLGSTGKEWIEKGGVYVMTNIRGGGEFGPRWHEAALKENRQKAYDDFAAIAEDLFGRKITSPRRLAIMGGSNGGLLVGTAMTEHPDYYHGVVCESALLDMIRYTQMPPGASWIGEYGDPADPKVASYISKFSPYQNVHSGVSYPKIFFHTSTADDRVQPGHSRKMVARMEENGNDVLMFEKTEGGHGGAADLKQRAEKSTLEMIYLYQQVMD